MIRRTVLFSLIVCLLCFISVLFSDRKESKLYPPNYVSGISDSLQVEENHVSAPVWGSVMEKVRIERPNYNEEADPESMLCLKSGSHLIAQTTTTDYGNNYVGVFYKNTSLGTSLNHHFLYFLFNPVNTHWSPDGCWLTVSGGFGDGAGLFLVWYREDTSTPSFVLLKVGQFSESVWINYNTIVYVENGFEIKIDKIEGNDGRFELVSSRVLDYGSQLAYDNNNNILYYVNLDGYISYTQLGINGSVTERQNTNLIGTYPKPTTLKNHILFSSDGKVPLYNLRSKKVIWQISGYEAAQIDEETLAVYQDHKGVRSINVYTVPSGKALTDQDLPEYLFLSSELLNMGHGFYSWSK